MAIYSLAAFAPSLFYMGVDISTKFVDDRRELKTIYKYSFLSIFKATLRLRQNFVYVPKSETNKISL